MSEPWTLRSIFEVFGHLVGIGDLSTTLQTTLQTTQAIIPLDITALRQIPSYLIEQVDTDADMCTRVKWPAGSWKFRAQFPPVSWPPDLDEGANVVVHLLLQRSGTTDNCYVDVLAFENNTGAYAADTEMGGKTGALSTTTITEVTVTLAHANITGHPGVLNLLLLPDAHTTDTIYCYGAWLEHKRKLVTS